MCRFVESIRIEEGKAHLIELHNARFHAARKALFGFDDPVDLLAWIKLPPGLSAERYKYRIICDGSNITTEIQPYEQRVIQSLKVVYNDDIDYSIKWENRSRLNRLFSLRNKCDDILIVKRGFVSDSSAANLLLFDGKEWITPSTPLLKGVQRQHLLDLGLIAEREVPISDLFRYRAIKLVNALIDFRRAPLIDIHTSVCFHSSRQ